MKRNIAFGLGLALLMGVLHWGGSSAAAFARAHPARMQMTEYAEFGEAILHGVRSHAHFVSYRMPLATTFASRLQYHGFLSPAAAASAGQIVLILLVFGLGMLLHPLGGLFSAAAAAALIWGAHDFNVYPDSIYSLLVLLSAGVLVWRERAPTPKRTAALALALGLTLLWRSPLALFPPLLALFEKPGAQRRKNRVILCLAPYLVLLPWVIFNWTVDRRLVPFEHRAASLNIATGALGLVENTEGDLRTLVGDSSVLGWAAGEIARHPVRYLSAVPKRVAYALSDQPVLAVLALIALIVFRRRRGHQAVGLLAAYYLGMHCLFTVEHRYFWPLWPLLAVLASSLPAAGQPKDESKPNALEARLASAVVLGALGLAAVAGLSAEAAVASFTARLWSGPGSGEEDFSRELARFPDDPWLLRERGRLRLNEGNPSGAAEDFARAARVEPADPRPRLQEARALLLLGKADAILAWNDPPGADFTLRADAAILKACALIRLGRTREARPLLKSALELYLGGNAVVRGEQGEHGRAVQDRLRTSDTGFVSNCLQLQGSVPAAQRDALDRELAALLPGASRVWISEAETAAARGERDRALRALARTGSLKMNPDEASRAAAAYRTLGEPAKALALLEKIPQSDSVRLERAVVETDLGRRETALKLLTQIESRRLNLSERRRLVALHERLGDVRGSAAALDSLISDQPGDAGLLVERAVLADRLGGGAGAAADLPRAEALPLDESARLRLAALWVDRAAAALREKDEARARSHLDRAAALRPDDRERLRMVSLRRALRDWEDAAALLEPLLKGGRTPSLLIERAEIDAGAGRRAPALEALAEAEKRADDGELSRAAHAYQNLKEYEKAISALDRLAARRPKDAEPLSDRGLCRQLQGRSAEAETDLKRAIALDPDLFSAYLTLGAVYVARKDNASAVKIYDAALARKPGRGDALRELLRRARAEAAHPSK